LRPLDVIYCLVSLAGGVTNTSPWLATYISFSLRRRGW